MYITNFKMVKGKPELSVSYQAESHDIRGIESIVTRIGCYNIAYGIEPIGNGQFLMNYYYWD